MDVVTLLNADRSANNAAPSAASWNNANRQGQEEHMLYDSERPFEYRKSAEQTALHVKTLLNRTENVKPFILSSSWFFDIVGLQIAP
jgi:hypothetical protein